MRTPGPTSSRPTRPGADAWSRRRGGRAAGPSGPRPVPQQAPTPQRREQALSACRWSAASAGVPLIVNDDLALALAIGADGVHLGATTATWRRFGAARAGRILGVSCYDWARPSRRRGGVRLPGLRRGCFRRPPSPTRPAPASSCSPGEAELACRWRPSAASPRQRAAACRRRRQPAGGDQRRLPPPTRRWPTCARLRRALPRPHRKPPHDQSQRRTLCPRPAHHPRRRQFAGPGLPFGGGTPRFLKKAPGRPGVGRRRRNTPRLRGLLGLGDPRPRHPVVVGAVRWRR